MARPSPPRLITCAGVEYDLDLLPHFVGHYLGLGIARERMHVVLHAQAAGHPGLRQARDILAAHGVGVEEVWTGPYTSDAMWARRRAVQARVAAPDDWIVSADVDEFHEYPAPLPVFLARCAEKGVNCAQGVFIDRLAPGGRLADLPPDCSPWQGYPLQADVICALGGIGVHHDWYGTVKLAVCRGGVFPSRGGHHPAPGDAPVVHWLGRPLATFPAISAPWFRFAVPLRVHHFKWTGSLLPALRRRVETPGVSRAGAEYGRKLLDYFERHGGVVLADAPQREGSAFDRLPWRLRVSLLRQFGRGVGLAQRSRRLAGARAG